MFASLANINPTVCSSLTVNCNAGGGERVVCAPLYSLISSLIHKNKAETNQGRECLLLPAGKLNVFMFSVKMQLLFKYFISVNNKHEFEALSKHVEQ